MTPLDYLDQYRIRLGDSHKDELKNSSKKNILKKFNSHPYFQSVMINNMATNVIVTQSKKSEEKQLLLMPESKVDIGSNVVIENISYLVMDFQGEGINEIYPSAALKLCNATYPIKANKTRLLKTDTQGNPVLDKFGDPVYVYTDGQITNLPCIAESSFVGSDENKQLPLPQGQLRITMQYQNVDDIKVNNTFTMYNNIYKIRNIDYTKVINNKGIVVLSVEQVTSEVK